MSKIRSKNTGLEKVVFRYLRCQKIYFQTHYKRAPGSPDIALPRKKKAVLIDSDFWHGWKFEETRKRLKKTKNSTFWINKIENNIKRDKKNRAALRKQGWKILRVWEHQLKQRPDATLEKIHEFLTQ